MSKEDFLFHMYHEFGKVPDLVRRYVPELDDYSGIDREELAIRIEVDN